MAKLKAFTWGYWGWGSESKHFIRAVDWLEKKRGFLPPVFVDLRIARSGSTVNFKGNAFRDIVGERRYVWMPKLGNKRIKTKTGKRLQIRGTSSGSRVVGSDCRVEQKAPTRSHVVRVPATHVLRKARLSSGGSGGFTP